MLCSKLLYFLRKCTKSLKKKGPGVLYPLKSNLSKAGVTLYILISRYRGALTLESGMGMCRGHDPLFSGQSALPSLPIYHQCAAHVPPSSIFSKILHFQSCFGQNFSSQDTNFPNFCLQDPSFLKENPLPRPYFWKPRWKPLWHTLTKKKKKTMSTPQ